jgi:hypothetical protein
MRKVVLSEKMFIFKWRLEEILAMRAGMTLDEAVWSKLYRMPNDDAYHFLLDYKSTGHDFGVGSVADKACELGLVVKEANE